MNFVKYTLCPVSIEVCECWIVADTLTLNSQVFRICKVAVTQQNQWNGINVVILNKCIINSQGHVSIMKQEMACDHILIKQYLSYN